VASASPRVAVVGATGYAGQELVRLLARHPRATLVAAAASSGAETPRRLPALGRIWDDPVAPFDPDNIGAAAEVAFLALPESASAEIAPLLLARGLRVFDLSGAFRLRDPAARARWYPSSPARADLTGVYGLPELNGHALAEAPLVACAGCYPTAALIALQPLVSAGLVEGDIVIDAKSGISGAGKTPSERTHFSECHGNVAAYGVFEHRHGPEIEQELGRPVTFVPHLVPLDRGILTTIYVRLRAGVTARDLACLYERAYAHRPCVRLTGSSLPEIKHVAYTPFCDLGWRLDRASSRAVLVACLDNLLKGAASQAVQNFNLAFGFDEREGLL
jgi:N-acetyl-gamma-glutamyl-phosphate reductase